METCPRHARVHFQSDLSVVAQSFALGVCHSRRDATAHIFAIWQQFCQDHNLDPTLVQYSDPVPLLQVFGHRYRSGNLAPSQTQVRGRTVGDAIRAVGQTLAGLGYRDPRLTSNGKLDVRLSRQLSSYIKHDTPPSRVKPIPITVLQQAAAVASLSQHPSQQAIADMIIIGFYFLLRPGEYAATPNPDAAPFKLSNVRLFRHERRLDVLTTPSWEIHSATFVGLEFSTQKNGVKGEIIGLGRSGHLTFCPVKAVINRVLHLRQHHAPLHTPLYTYYHANHTHVVTTAHLTNTLRSITQTFGARFGLIPSDISVRSLRSSGAMALLCANIDTDRIRLLGRWRSDEMLRYLHVQAVPIVAPIAAAMLRHGHFSLLPARPQSPSQADHGAGPQPPGGTGGL